MTKSDRVVFQFEEYNCDRPPEHSPPRRKRLKVAPVEWAIDHLFLT